MVDLTGQGRGGVRMSIMFETVGEGEYNADTDELCNDEHATER